jgi:hypothetical protein
MSPDPMLHVRDQAMRLCETQIRVYSAALDLVDEVPRLLLVPPATLEDWGDRAARWRARAALIDWAARSPVARLPQVMAQLERDAGCGGHEGQDVAQLLATLQLAMASQGASRGGNTATRAPGVDTAGGRESSRAWPAT